MPPAQSPGGRRHTISPTEEVEYEHDSYADMSAEETRPKCDYDFSQTNGYNQPHANFTQIPDELIDFHMASLSEGELKALLFIMRQTWGWKKEADAISLNQMVNGITRRDGTVVSRGTGMSKPSVVKALRGLQDKNLVYSLPQKSTEKGFEPTLYSLRTIAPPSKESLLGGGKDSLQAPLLKILPTQETTTKQETTVQDSRLTAADIAAAAREVMRVLSIPMNDGDYRMLQAKIKRLNAVVPDEDPVELARTCYHKCTIVKPQKVNSWIAMYCAFIKNAIEDARGGAHHTEKSEPQPPKGEPDHVAPAKGSGFFDAVITWLDYLSDHEQLPARQTRDYNYRQLSFLSFDGSTLVLRKPPGFHEYDTVVWPNTIKSVAEEQLGRNIDVQWETTDGQAREESQPRGISRNGYRPVPPTAQPAPRRTAASNVSNLQGSRVSSPSLE